MKYVKTDTGRTLRVTNYVKFLSHHITEDVKTDTENTKTDKNSEA